MEVTSYKLTTINVLCCLRFGPCCSTKHVFYVMWIFLYLHLFCLSGCFGCLLVGWFYFTIFLSRQTNLSLENKLLWMDKAQSINVLLLAYRFLMLCLYNILERTCFPSKFFQCWKALFCIRFEVLPSNSLPYIFVPFGIQIQKTSSLYFSSFISLHFLPSKDNIRLYLDKERERKEREHKERKGRDETKRERTGREIKELHFSHLDKNRESEENEVKGIRKMNSFTFWTNQILRT